MLKYKGYTGNVTVDYEANIIHGRVLDLQDVITFQGCTPGEVERAFRESIDEYLKFCKELGRSPEKPFSGIFSLRISPDLHRRITVNASVAGQSLNQWAIEAFEQRLDTDRRAGERGAMVMAVEEKKSPVAAAVTTTPARQGKIHRFQAR